MVFVSGKNWPLESVQEKPLPVSTIIKCFAGPWFTGVVHQGATTQEKLMVNGMDPFKWWYKKAPHVIWVTGSGKLYRVAPEHVRSLSAMEETSHQQTLALGQPPDSILPSIIPSHGGVQYHNLINSPSIDNPNNPAENNPHNHMINQLPNIQVP